MSTIAQLRNGANVAAWIFKANPVVWDVLGALRSPEGREALDTWGMAPSYRVDLVRPGQPCVLWVTGGRHSTDTGAWAIGEITSEPFLDEGDPDDSRWTDEQVRSALRPHVHFRLDVLQRPVTLAELYEDPRFARAEIIRAPRVSSPVALTADEFAAIKDAVEHRPGAVEH